MTSTNDAVQALRNVIRANGGDTYNRAAVGSTNNTISIALRGDHRNLDVIAVQRQTGAKVVWIEDGIIHCQWQPKQEQVVTRTQSQSRGIDITHLKSKTKQQQQPEQPTPQSHLYTGDRVQYGQPEPGFWGKLFGRG